MLFEVRDGVAKDVKTKAVGVIRSPKVKTLDEVKEVVAEVKVDAEPEAEVKVEAEEEAEPKAKEEAPSKSKSLK